MQNLLLEVKSIRRCEGGHACSLTANGRKVAFIGQDIFEWTSDSKRMGVIGWYASKEKLQVKQLQPVELKEGWQSRVPDHKFSDLKDDATEAALHEWVKMHFVAFELVQRCKNVLMTLGHKGEILDWGIPPGNATDTLKRVAADRFSSKLLNGLSISELVKVLEGRKRANKSTAAVKV